MKANPKSIPMTQPVNRLCGSLPKIGIRPIIDGRRKGVREGLEEQTMEILGTKIPMNTIPITPGRNLAVILEVAAMNNRQRRMGYNPAEEFTQRINEHFASNSGAV